MNTLLLHIFLLCRILAAMEINLSESDIKEYEKEGKIPIRITATRGSLGKEGNVTLHVVPLTLTQFRATGRSLPKSLSMQEYDPAEADMDFNSSIHIINIPFGYSSSTEIDIKLIQDGVSELEEVFLITLKVAEDTPVSMKEEVTLGSRDFTVAHILQSYDERASIRFSSAELTVNEANDTIEDQLFIEVEGQIEPEVFVKLTLNDATTSPNDTSLLQLRIPIITNGSHSHRIPVPLHVVDDQIAEEVEVLYLRVERDTVFEPLFGITEGFVKISIQDDDVPRIGFELNENETSVTVMEGGTREVCVGLLWPKKMEVILYIHVTLTPDSPRDIVNVSFEDQFNGLSARDCFNISAKDNLVLNHPVTVTLNLTVSPLYIFPTGNEELLVEPSLLNLNILDDEGVPVPPTTVSLHYVGDQLHITWEASISELQPVDRFIVIIVKATPTSSTHSQSRRQVNYWEYETVDTSITLNEMDPSQSYTVTVCAENSLGRMCSTTTQLNNVEPLSLVAAKEKKPSLLIIVVAVVGSVVLIVLMCSTLLCCVFVCKCCHEKGHYYPSQEEKKINENVSVEPPKYCKQHSSTSTLNMEWIAPQPKSDITKTPPTCHVRPYPILGTPV